ncbi:serine hydrolase domain-containing protein [Sutcliffiella cohnii]
MRENVCSFLQKEVDFGHIPGAVIQVAHKGKVIIEEAIGNRSVHPETAPMERDTIFDLASLTKVIGTLPAILKLVDEGEIILDDQVSFFFPAFATNGKEQVTVKNLLTHTSGFPSHQPFYLYNLKSDEIFERICKEELVFQPGRKVIYSDLGFITLYKIVEKISGEKFDVFLKREIFEPLQMLETGFNPTFEPERFASTEYNEGLNNYKHGIVHDENAEAMGGISGHAGLFSSISDLSNFADMIENGGMFQGNRVLSSSIIRLSKSNFTLSGREFRGLGWILQKSGLSACGDLFSDQSFGHTGFTGTSIWFDPVVDLRVILLTNRVHFGRENHILRIRPRLHNIIRSYF